MGHLWRSRRLFNLLFQMVGSFNLKQCNWLLQMAVEERNIRQTAYPKMIYRHKITKSRAELYLKRWSKLIQFLTQLRNDTITGNDRDCILAGSVLTEIRGEIRREWKHRNGFYTSEDPKIIFCDKAQQAIQEQLDKITGVQSTLFS